MTEIYKATVNYVLDGQMMSNRFHYKMIGVPAAVSGSFALFAAMGGLRKNPDGTPAGGFTPDSLLEHIRAIQGVPVKYDSLIVDNLYSPTDFYEGPFAQQVQGQNTSSDTMPPMIAASFRTSRVSKNIRRGQKRIAGIVEQQVAPGGILEDAALTGHIQALANKMAATLSYDDEGNQIDFKPVVLGTNKVVQPDGSTSYEIYPTLAEQLVNSVDGFFWEARPRVTTQNSRKYGRGV